MEELLPLVYKKRIFLGSSTFKIKVSPSDNVFLDIIGSNQYMSHTRIYYDNTQGFSIENYTKRSACQVFREDSEDVNGTTTIYIKHNSTYLTAFVYYKTKDFEFEQVDSVPEGAIEIKAK